LTEVPDGVGEYGLDAIELGGNLVRKRPRAAELDRVQPVLADSVRHLGQ